MASHEHAQSIPQDDRYLDSDGRPRLLPSVLLFGDLLGVKEMALAANAGEFLDKLDQVINRDSLITSVVAPQSWSAGLASDSVVVAAPIELPGGESVRDAIRSVVVLAARLQVRFMESGFFLRGAIALGALHMYGNIVFGAALVEAVLAEQALAKYPRVVLAPSAETVLEAVHDPADGLGGAIGLDGDDIMFVDYLDLLAGDAGEQRETALSGHKRIIEMRLEGYRDQPKAHAKYEWMGEYHNGFCHHIGLTSDRFLLTGVGTLNYKPLVHYRGADLRTERLGFGDVVLRPKI